MTKQEKIIATAYTGIMFVDGKDLGDVYAYEEKMLGTGVIDIMHASKGFCDEVREAVRSDFIDMLKGKYENGTDNASEEDIVYVVTRCEEHSDYVERVFLDKSKAEEYCEQFNGCEDEYYRDITEIKMAK